MKHDSVAVVVFEGRRLALWVIHCDKIPMDLQVGKEGWMKPLKGCLKRSVPK